MRLRVALLVLPALLVWATPTEEAGAQGIPRRVQTLQQIAPNAPEPDSQVQKLRDDIIRATDPATGALNARQLRKPPSSRPTLGGEAPGVLGVDRPPSSRPDSGGVAPGITAADIPPSSRPGSGGVAPD